MNYKIILFAIFFSTLYSKTKAQEQPSTISFKKQFIGPPKYIQDENKINFKELTSVLKPNPIAYSLILDAKKTRNWAKGIEAVATITFVSFLFHTVNTAINSSNTYPYVPVIIDGTGLVLMVSSVGLKAIANVILKRSETQTQNSIKVYNDGLATSANLYKLNFGITPNGLGLSLKF